MTIQKDVTTTTVDTTTIPPASVDTPKDPNVPIVDYKKLYEETKANDEAKAEQLKKAEHTIVTLKKGKKRDDEADGGDPVDPVIDIEGIKNQVVEEARKDLETTRYEIVSETVDNVIAGMSDNPDEQKLIKYVYEKKIVKSGTSRKDIMTDLTSAFVLANKDRFYTENEELKKSLISKQTITKPSVAGQSGVHDESVKLSPEEEKWVDSAAQRTGRPREEIVKKLLSNKK